MKTSKPHSTASAETTTAAKAAAAPVSKIQILTDLLARESGVDIAEMMEATGWQAHSVRGALAGGLKKKGLRIESLKAEGRRVYRLVEEGGAHAGA